MSNVENARLKSLAEDEKTAAKNGDKAKVAQDEAEAKNWETGGKYDLAAKAAIGVLSGSPTGAGMLVAGASPYVSHAIGEATQGDTAGDKAANILLHTAWGAVSGHAETGNALAGAIGEGGSAAAAQVIQSQMYPGIPKDQLTEQQKQNISTVVQAVTGALGAVAGAATGGDAVGVLASAGQAQASGKNEVENNHLSAHDAIEEQELNNLPVCDKACQQKKQELQDKSRKSDEKLWNCEGKSTPECEGARQEAKEDRASYQTTDGESIILSACGKTDSCGLDSLGMYQYERQDADLAGREAISQSNGQSVLLATIAGTGEAIWGTAKTLGSAVITGVESLTGNEQAREAISDFWSGGAYTYLTTGDNAKTLGETLIGYPTEAQNQAEAQAWLNGDAQTIGKIEGGQAAAALGAAGTVATMGAGTVAKVGEIAKAAETAEAAGGDVVKAASEIPKAAVPGTELETGGTSVVLRNPYEAMGNAGEQYALITEGGENGENGLLTLAEDIPDVAKVESPVQDLINTTPTEFLYRGVSANHPAIDAARNGEVIPGDINNTSITPELHNEGGYSAISPYTSWTHNPEIAIQNAGENGVVLRVPVGAPPEGAEWHWEFSPDVYHEDEILLWGIRKGDIDVLDPKVMK